MEIQIKSDEITPWLEKIGGENMYRYLASAMKSEGYRLKMEMSRAIRTGAMGWHQIHPLTKALRKTRPSAPPGFWFARFVRYLVRHTNQGPVLEVGVLKADRNIAKMIQAPSRMISLAAERFEKGWKKRVTRQMIAGRIKAYLRKRKIVWSELSPARKRRVKASMRRAGVFAKVGTIIKAPARTLDKFIAEQGQKSTQNIMNLFQIKALGLRYSKDWWRE